jgi:hypothetical protein
MTVLGIKYIISSGVNPLLQGDLALGFVLILGLMLYFRFSKKYFFLCRWPLSFMIGIGLGLTLRGWTHGWLWQGMIVPTISALYIEGDALQSFNNIITLVITVTVLSYFIFGMAQKGALAVSAKFGRYFMMIMFGVMFSSYNFARLAGLGQQLIWIINTIARIFK